MDWTVAIWAVERLVTIGAILVGGLWAYFKFIKGRVYRIRIEPTASGRAVCDGKATYLIATVSLKNSGLSKVDFQHEGSGLRVYAYQGARKVTDAQSARWERLATFPIFEDHQWIESGETITEDRMVEVPGCDHFAFLVEVRVVSQKVSFKTRRVVTLAAAKDGTEGHGS